MLCERFFTRNQEGSTFSTKTGSVCCVAARPRGSTRNSDGWSVGPTEPYWRVNGGYSPPLSATWEQKQLRGSPFSSRRSSVSSPFSLHQLRDLHVISSVSPLDSPSEGFRLPQWTPLSNDASMGDFIAAAAEPSTRTSALTPTSEACMLTGISGSLSSSSQRLTKDTLIVTSNRPLHPYRSFSRHCLSKLGSRRLFARQKLDGVARFGSAGRRNLLSENEQGSGHQSEGDGKQPMTLSQLVASSTQEVFGWSDVNSVSQLSWNADEDGLKTYMPLPFERIRADVFQPDESSGSVDHDKALEKCSLCCRDLSRWSPWSLETYGGSYDLPVVGVLVCGHTFHAECLEKSGSDTSKSNPHCPQCMQIEIMSLKGFARRFDCVKHTITPLKRQLTRLLKAKSFNLVSRSNEDGPGLPRSLTSSRKGVFLRSLSKLQAPLQVKATKDSGSHNLVST